MITSPSDPNRSKLDQFVLDIEFLLISVVQGVALAGLATASIDPLVNLRFEYWPYIITAFLIVLSFWSGAIIHSLSFINWPLNLVHNFLYFLAAFIEVLAFSQIENSLNWYAFIFLFFLVIIILYFVDLKLINRHEDSLKDSPEKKALFKHIKQEQIFELILLIPVGLIFNLVAFYSINSNNSFFIIQKNHLFFGVIQMFILVGFLANSIRSFKKRSKLISNLLRV